MSQWILTSDDESPTTFRLPTGAVKTIGRTARADFILDAPLVSRVHCRLTADPSGQLVVEDLESQNGTFVNGRKVGRATVKAGDRITVGRVNLTIDLV